MECQHWREALSARLDGEEPGRDDELLDAHLDGCPPCREHLAAIERLHRSLRLRTADEIPDLTDAILAGAAADRRRPGLTLLLRWVLVCIAALEMGLAAPELIGRWHAGGELGTWGIAVAIGFLSVAHKPARAAALLPMLAVAGVLTVAVAARHLADGSALFSDEWPHGLLLAGVAVLVVIWRREAAAQLPDPQPAMGVDAAGRPVQVRRAA